jgi:predicted DCC family thiol-disulfide oxidoreductase YuxK
VLLFDGVCTLCSGVVRFVIDRDRSGRFQFAALQSDAGRRLLGGLTEPLPDSFVLFEKGRVFTRSAAALRIARGLPFPWPVAWAFIIVPRPVRDWAYDVIARHRYRWFGRRDTCMVPTPEQRARFLDL